MKYIALLIEGDNENSLGGACQRDIWNISKKIIDELPINVSDFYTFFHDMNNTYIDKIKQLSIRNIFKNDINNIKKCFDHITTLSQTEQLIIYFHYSGHGYQRPDHDGDEIDGRDEVFIGGSMSDDFIWNELISKLSRESHIFLVIDACHSGSGADLPYVWNDEKSKWVLSSRRELFNGKETIKKSGMGEKENIKMNNVLSKCSGFSLSACNDSQLSMQDVGNTTGFAGSLTAGICDLGNMYKFIFEPSTIYKLLVPRLKNLNQTVCLHSVSIK